MFLGPNYVLANELVEKMGIHIANISMLAQNYEDYNSNVVKMNNCTFINKKNPGLPKNFQIAIENNSFTDMSDKLPCTFVRDEYQVSEKTLLKGDIVKEKVKISGKDFYVFKPEFVKTMKNKIGYILDKEETESCLRNNQIEGSIKLGNNKFFTWYSV